MPTLVECSYYSSSSSSSSNNNNKGIKGSKSKKKKSIPPNSNFHLRSTKSLSMCLKSKHIKKKKSKTYLKTYSSIVVRIKCIEQKMCVCGRV